MPQGTLVNLFRMLRRLRAAHEGHGLTDGALLERFLSQQDEAAFEILMQRHGPMVLGVCRRAGGDDQVAEDAFQATFLVLARRAASVRKKASIGSWLHGVARRIARKARTQEAARRERERRAAEMPRTEPLDERTLEELRAVLDEEIGRLPEKYRTAIVLRYLEGKSFEQAAQELGCPTSTLATRVQKACELLRGQLKRRGIALSVAALATALTEKAWSAPVSALLTINLVTAARSVAAGKPLAAGILSTQAIALAEQAMKTMIGITGKLIVLLAVLGLAVGAGLAGHRAWVEQPPPKVDEKQPPVAEAQPAKKDPVGPAKVLPGGWRHDGTVLFAAFLPDGKQVVTASADGNIRLWQYPTGKEIRRIAMPEGSVRGMVALSSDGKMIAAAKLDETEIYLFDLATGKQLLALKWAAPEEKRQIPLMSRLAFSPNGEHLAALNRASVVSIWDWAKGKEIRKFATGEGLRGAGLTYAPDGKSILTIDFSIRTLGKTEGVTDSFLKIWDPATGAEKCAIEKVQPFSSMVDAVSFSPDGKSLAICSLGGIVIVDSSTGKQTRRLTNKLLSGSHAGGLLFAKDGTKLYYPFAEKIVEYDVATGKLLRQYQGNVGNPSLSPDGNTLVGGRKRLQFLDLSGKELVPLLSDDNDASNPPPKSDPEVEAVRLIQQLGGNITRDDKLPGNPVIGLRFVGSIGLGNGGKRVQMTDAEMKALKEFKQLTSLNISGCPAVTGAGLKELKELEQLTTLTLGDAQATEAGLRELKDLKPLTKLLIRGRVTDADLKGLKEVKQLKELLLPGCKEVTGVGFSELRELKQLTTLNLHGTNVTDEGLKELKEFKQLKTLFLGKTKITDAGLKELKDLKQLTTLRLASTAVTDEGLKELKELKQLTTLHLAETAVTGVGLKELKELKQLTALNLHDAKITVEGLKELKQLKQLEELTLGQGITDEGMKELKELTELTKLALFRTSVTGAGLAELKELKQLQELTLGGDEVTDASLKGLKDHKQLKELKLSNCQNVTDEGLKELKELKQLTSLNLIGRQNVTAAGVRKLQEALPKCKISR